MSGEEEKRELGKEMIGTTIEIDGDIPFEVREKLKNKSVFENETCFLYRNARGCSLQAWSQKKEGMYVTTRFGNASNLHYIDSPLHYRKQLTYYEDAMASVSLRPHSPAKNDELLFLKDTGGNEKHQIYYTEVGKGRATLLTDGVSKYTSLTWSKCGKFFAFCSTKRNGKDYDVYVASLNFSGASVSMDIETILPREGMWTICDWVESVLLLKKIVSSSNSDLFLYDIEASVRQEREKGEERKEEVGDSPFVVQLEDQGKDTSYSCARFVKKNEKMGIVFASDRLDNDLNPLYFTSLTSLSPSPLSPLSSSSPSSPPSSSSLSFSLSGEFSLLTEGMKWEIEGISVSKCLTRFIYVVNEDGLSQMYLNDFKDENKANVPIQLSIGGVLMSLSFHPTNSDLLGFSISTPNFPSDVFSIDLSNVSKKNETPVISTRWSESEKGEIPDESVLSYSVVRIPSFDSLPFSFFHYPPTAASASSSPPKKHPVMINIHGGPASQFRPSFSPTFHFYAHELQIALICPNVRGSTGYGKKFMKADDGYLRDNSVLDIGAILDWIDQQEDLDSSNVMVSGGSYGGFMVLASLIKFGDRLKCGVERVGITNWVTFLENTSDYRRDHRRQEYGDERDEKMREFLLQISPLTNVEKLSQPLLIMQGAQDPRVPLSESVQLFNSLKSRNIAVWYLCGLNEGHGFRKKNNQDIYSVLVAEFLKNFLLKKD